LVLEHESEGFDADHKHKPAAANNKKLFLKRVKNLEKFMSDDDLTSLEYDLKETEEFKIKGKTLSNVFLRKVES
jgi:hypothetical protein